VSGEPPPAPHPDPAESRWRFLRDVSVFQLKLLLDGLRDALMIPLSIAAAVLDLLTPGPEDAGLFYRLVKLGERSEAFIDVFEVARRDAAGRPVGTAGERGVDDLLRHVEDFLLDQEQRGGLTAATRARVDRLLDAVSRSRFEREP
jgi:hypothetical protein